MLLPCYFPPLMIFFDVRHIAVVARCYAAATLRHAAMMMPPCCRHKMPDMLLTPVPADTTSPLILMLPRCCYALMIADTLFYCLIANAIRRYTGVADADYQPSQQRHHCLRQLSP